MQVVETKKLACERLIHFIRNYSVTPEEINPLLNTLETEEIRQKGKLLQILLRPQVFLMDLLPFLPKLQDFLSEISNPEDFMLLVEQVEITLKYEGYIEKEVDMVNKFNKMESVILKDDFNYNSFNSLSMEARIKLTSIKPKTLGQASRISGISPADISVLMVHLSH